MSRTPRTFDIATAFVGQIVRHVASQKCYSITRVAAPQGTHDAYVALKNPYGQMAFVGSEYIDPDEFVSL